MNLPLDAVLIGVATLLATLVAWLVASRGAAASRRLEMVQASYSKARVDAETYERARIQYESIIAALRADNVDLHVEVERLKSTVEALSRRVRQFERDRVAHGLGPLDSARQSMPHQVPVTDESDSQA